VDEDDFDLGGFDEAYSPDDFSQADMDFATAVGMQTAGAGSDDDSAAQFIANQFAQPQAGMNRSNIIGTANFDPQFAAAFDISRGLDPTNNFGGVGGLSVPSYLRPQTPGNLVLNEAGDRMMYGSPVERFAQETAPELVRGFQNMGIGALINRIGSTISDAFTDAKSALGFDGGAQGGLTSEDFTGMMSTRDDMSSGTVPMSNMSQQGAGISVTDPVVTRPADFTGLMSTRTPTFDAFGNVTRDANMSRFADQFGQINAGIASVAPNMAREANISVDDAVNPTSSFTNFNAKEYLDDFEKSLRQRQIENNKRNRDRLLSGNKMADASQFLNPQAISRGLNYFAGPQIQDFFRGVTNNPNTTIRLGPGFDMDKQKVDDNIFNINIPFATG